MTTEVTLDDIPINIENVHIRGLQRTKDRYVRQAINKIFYCSNFNDIILKSEELRQILYGLGCFNSIDLLIDASKNSKNKNVFDIYYDVKELSRVGGAVHTSVGNNEGALSVSVSLPNLFGQGEKVTFESTYGTRNNTDYRLTYQMPVNMNPKKTFSVSLFQTMNEFSWNKFKERNVGFNMNITSPFSLSVSKNYLLNGNHQFSYEGTWRNLIGSIDSAFEIREQSGHSLKSALKYACTIDKRTNPILSNDGGYSNFSVELAGLGGDVQYLKVNNDYQYSKTFFKYIITQLTLSTGFIAPWGQNENIRVNDRFFLGGPLTMRGFTTRGAGPHKEESAMGDDAYWIIGLHVYTPLPFFHKEEKLSSWFKTHTFLNIGNLLSLKRLRTLESNRFEYLTNEARLSIGTGLVIKFANIARLELNYVLPLWKQQYDKSINGLQFGIGIMFN